MGRAGEVQQSVDPLLGNEAVDGNHARASRQEIEEHCRPEKVGGKAGGQGDLDDKGHQQ